MSPAVVGVIGVLLLVVLIFCGMPVGFAIFFVGLIGFSYLVSLSAGISLVAKDLFQVFTWYNFSVVPMFIFMGYLAFESGLSRRLYEAAYAWIGHLRGGLAMATIVACAGFGALCASPTATSATMGVVALPEMKKYKYDPAISTATVAAGGILGIMIPPSVIFIIYGIVTENSIAKLFLAGFLPGIMLVMLLSSVIYVKTLFNPTLCPPGPKVGFKKRFGTLRKGTWETLAIFALVMGGLTAGISTATEAGAIGAISVLLLALVRRQLDSKGFVRSLKETTRTTAMIFIFLAGVTVFGRFLAVTRIPDIVASTAIELALPRSIIMISILLIYFIFGCIIDPLPFMLITIPVFYPLVISLGYDPIWYGVMMVCVCGTGGITPPVGIMVYVVAGIAKDVPLETVLKGVWPFVGAMIVGIALLLIFPQIATFLPNLFMP